MLPPNDPRFLGITPDAIEAEYWAWHYWDKPASESEEDDNYDADAVIEAMNNGDWEEVIND